MRIFLFSALLLLYKKGMEGQVRVDTSTNAFNIVASLDVIPTVFVLKIRMHLTSMIPSYISGMIDPAESSGLLLSGKGQ